MPVIYNFDIRTLYIWTTFYPATAIHNNKWSASLVRMVVNLCCLVQCSQEYLGFVSPNILPGLRMYLCVCLESLLESVPITARDTSIHDVRCGYFCCIATTKDQLIYIFVYIFESRSQATKNVQKSHDKIT